MKRLMLASAAVFLAGTPCSAQDGGKPKPNVAVSGCLMREGYGNIVVTNANLDAVGEAAATPAGTGKPAAAQNPPKWVLDHPGSVQQHIGEKVQVIGVSSWVEDTKGGSKPPSGDEPPGAPHIEVQSVKVLASSCS